MYQYCVVGSAMFPLMRVRIIVHTTQQYFRIRIPSPYESPYYCTSGSTLFPGSPNKHPFYCTLHQDPNFSAQTNPYFYTSGSVLFCRLRMRILTRLTIIYSCVILKKCCCFDECNATDLLSKYSRILQEIYTGIFYPNWYIVNNHNNIIYRYTTPPRLLDQ